MLAMLTLSDRDAYAHAYRVAALVAQRGTRRSAWTSPNWRLRRARGAAARPRQARHAGSDAAQAGAAHAEEQVLVRLHPTIAADLAAQVPFLAAAAGSSGTCTNGWTASGIRAALRAADVSLGARIVCLADAYDTMTRPRVFRDALPPGDAVLELARCSDSQFDPAVVDAFRQVIAAQ